MLSETNLLQSKSVRLFLILGGFFIANALAAEFMGVKIFSLEASLGLAPFALPLFGNTYSFSLTTGVLLWPVVFIMTDLINEYYGKRGVQFLSYLAAALIAYAFLMFSGAISLTPADWWVGSQTQQGVMDMNKAYSAIFGQGLGIIIGSLLAFLIGQILDVIVFHQIKKRTGERFIWLRATGSTLFSQLIDSFVVLFVAFYFFPKCFSGNGEPWAVSLVLAVGVGNYIYKFIVAILMTPVLYLVHEWIERYLGKELAKEMKEKAAK